MVDYVKVLAAKKEVTYATDAAPTLAANAIVTRNFSAKPVETDTLERNLDNRTFGAQPVAPANERQTISYEVELAGSGAAGTAAPWQELLEGCGFAPPVLTATIKAQQVMALAGTAQSSLDAGITGSVTRSARWWARAAPRPWTSPPASTRSSPSSSPA